MFFGQKVHPLSFEYGSRATVKPAGIEVSGDSFKAKIRCDAISDFCTRLRIENGNIRDPRHYSDGILEEHRKGKPVRPGRDGVFAAPSARIEVGANHLAIALPHGFALQTGPDGFGFNGVRTILNFETPGVTGFHGFGERTRRFNKSGDSMEFLTVDVMAVWPHTYSRDDYDPTYVSIPFAILRQGGQYCGLYLDSAEHLVMDCGQICPGRFIIQAMDGHSHLYVINGPTLRQVVRNFAALTGRAELPPAWALGHHQCRWGYQSTDEYIEVAAGFARHDLPLSCLWYDIDYMDEYRVFTWDKRDIPSPRKLNQTLKRKGVRSVAIIDPGVKLDPGYSIYDGGKKADIFCKAPSGRDFVGRVWPGDTVFPDFTLESGREWWAGHVAKFLDEASVDGAWLDMNDPSTGWSATEDMLFERGKTPHSRFHNQYGHYMAKASWQAFQKLDPQRRPFILTRSGFTGTQRYSAIWTGDNDSNWSHLRMSIPCTINLGLSGVGFNGPDVGGFAGHTTPELLVRWYQAGFLFPFFRNHSIMHSKPQEPWEFGPEILTRIREVLHTRYRLLPYLYQCFFENHLTGDPILRPLLYEFDGTELENLDDQFLIGPHLMAAPIVHSDAQGDFLVADGVRRQLRHVTFPAGWWYDLNLGEWIEGGRTMRYAAGIDEAPLFVREGAIIPWYNGPLKNGDTPLNDFELHVFLRQPGVPATATLYLEDQKTRKYLQGQYNTASISIAVQGAGAIAQVSESGPLPAGSFKLDRLVLYGLPQPKSVSVHGKSRTLKRSHRQWIGKKLPVTVIG
ncbi:MAG TPA: glycoside hydrolase family 31 protein [Chthoniobacteraceae bacterium]|jgi:alpha-glucosidase|nr:glycoside hydrolase family 31 protein [Chthoniobacteraceae bacterium]